MKTQNLALAVLFIFALVIGCEGKKKEKNVIDDVVLTDQENQADYIIITVPDLATGLAELVPYREAQGLTVVTIDLQSIIETFGDTTTTVSAIRGFISYTIQNWTPPAPRYLLLAGDTHIIPSFRVVSFFHGSPLIQEDSVSIDEFMVINPVDPDSLPDLAVGRLPAGSASDLSNMVQKTIAFESIQADDYQYDYSFCVDSTRSEGRLFAAFAEDMVSQVSPASNIQTIVITGDDLQDARSRLLDTFDSGTLFLTYAGFGENGVLSDSVLTVADFDLLTGSERPNILLNLNFEDFDHPGETTVSEMLLLVKDGGSVAAWAPSGGVFLTESWALQESFFQNIQNGAGSRIGDLILQTKLMHPSNLVDLDYGVRRWTFFGDPALLLPSLD